MKIEYTCDYCGRVGYKDKYKYKQARLIIEKNSCNNQECMKQKRRDVFQKKYNIDSVGNLDIPRRKLTSEEIQVMSQKRRETNINKYGVDNVFLSDEIKEKARQTKIEKYGTDNPMSLDIVKSKLKQSMMSKYGVVSPLQYDEFKDKAKKTSLERYGSEIYTQSDEYKQYVAQNRKTHNGYNIDELCELTDKSITVVYEQIKKFGVDYVINQPKYASGLEEFMAINLRKAGIEFKREVWLDGYRADFLIDNLIVEVNGNYWHNDHIIQDKYYHFNKKQHYTQAGYASVFFQEDEIYDNIDIIMSMISHRLNLSNVIYGRKTNFILANKYDGTEFLNDNHLMGHGRGVYFALIYNHEIISCLQAYKQKDEMHISRYANKISTSVTGGFSKLLKYAIQYYNPKKVINFVDGRYGTGQHLINLGFKLINNDISFVWTNNKTRVHRMKFPKNSGYENGYYKIWDCGQMKYVLEL